eukprot:2500067-Rhodomonas_salina.1
MAYQTCPEGPVVSLFQDSGLCSLLAPAISTSALPVPARKAAWGDDVLPVPAERNPSVRVADSVPCSLRIRGSI